MSLKSKRINQIYRCKQEELYQVLLLGWESYQQKQPQFKAISTIYTVAYGNTQRQAVLDAKAMPDYQERDEASETLLVLLKEAADQCLIQWKYLESNITKAYPKNQHKPKLEAAGSKHYNKAGNNDWESVSALMESGANFITKNNAELITGGMPPTFPTAFATARTTFDTLYQQFKDAEQTKEQQRDDKIKANNLIYQTSIAMFLDGQKIFRNDAATRERFTFSQILELVSGTSGGNGGTPPTTETIVIATKQNPPAPFSIEIMGTLGEETTIEWSDGTSDTITMDGTFVSISHTYSAIGNYTISITGAKAAFTEMQALNGQHSSINLPDTINLRGLTLNDNQFSSLFIPATYTDLIALSAANNDIDQQSINLILTTINDFGTSNGVIYLNGGNNQPPNGQGIAAKNALQARGWIVLTN